MSISIRPIVVVLAGVLAAPSVLAVNIIGVYDLAVKNDPQLQAAAYRRDAAGESTVQARSSLLPTLSASGSMTKGSSETSIAGFGVVSDTDTDTENLNLSLSQSLYNHAT